VGEVVACEESGESEANEAGVDDGRKGSLGGFRAWVVVSGGSNSQDGVGLVVVMVVDVVDVIVNGVVCCIAVAVDVAVQGEGRGEARNDVGEEEHLALDLGEGSCMTGLEQAVEVVAVAGYLNSDLGARIIHDESGLFYWVQNIVCRSPRVPA
jgi:hypothetical protein